CQAPGSWDRSMGAAWAGAVLAGWSHPTTIGYGILAYRWFVELNAWCELSVRNLRERCPRIRVGLLTDPEGKEPALLDRRGHLPNCTLRHRGRLSPVPLSREVPTRPRDVSESQRGSYPGSLRSVGPLRQRAGLLPLRNEPSAR